MKISPIKVAAVLTLVVIMSSCRKDDEDTSFVSSLDNARAENTFNDLFNVANEAANRSDDEGEMKQSTVFYIGQCATVSIAPAWPDPTFPKTITVDFGASGCIGLDGRLRSGAVEITATGFYRDAGTVLTSVPVNYSVDGFAVTGTKTVTNQGLNIQENLHYSVEISDGLITSPNGETISWESNRDREWVEGQSTNIFSNGIAGLTDDVYLITGGSEGIDRNGRNFEVNIAQPLRIELDCRWIVSGIVELKPDGLRTRSVDFGNQECDNIATFSVGDFTSPITLP